MYDINTTPHINIIIMFDVYILYVIIILLLHTLYIMCVIVHVERSLYPVNLRGNLYKQSYLEKNVKKQKNFSFRS